MRLAPPLLSLLLVGLLMRGEALNNASSSLDLTPHEGLGRWRIGESRFETAITDDAGVIHLKDSDTGRNNGLLTLELNQNELNSIKGRRIRFVTEIKKSSGDCGLRLQARGASEELVQEQEELKLPGETPWAQYAVTLEIPQNAVSVTAALLCANGWGKVGEACFRGMRIHSIAAASPPARSKIEAKHGAILELFHDAPMPHWKLYGGLEESELTAFHGSKGLRFTASRDMRSHEVNLAIASNSDDGSIASQWNVANRHLDLSDFRGSNGWLEFHAKPLVRMNVCGVPLDLAAATPEADGWFRHRVPLETMDKAFHCSNAGRLTFQIAQEMKKGENLSLDEIVFTTRAEPGTPRFVFADQETENFVATACATEGGLPPDRFVRPEIQNGTFQLDGKPVFLLGPHYCDMHWGLSAAGQFFKDPLNAKSFYFNLNFDKAVAKDLGFSSLQLNSYPTIPMQQALGLPMIHVDALRRLPEFMRGLGGMPIVVDSALLSWRCGSLEEQDPTFPKDALQQNPDWHAFIPFCPEHPLGKRIYEEYFKRGVMAILKAGGNPYVHEIFNESAYDCRCEFNKRAFLERLKERYSDIAAANSAWRTAFPSFEAAVWMKGKYESVPGFWVDWCEFSGKRYVSVLREMIGHVRQIDRRKNVYFTEQLHVPKILDVTGAGMDYLEIAKTLDVLCIEGAAGKFGSPPPREAAKANELVEVMDTESHGHGLIPDLFTALSKGRKPVIDDELYIVRQWLGERVPSKREDISSSLWHEVFHGVSASYAFTWAGDAWAWDGLEGAKKFATDGPDNSGKTATLLNPYNYPVEALRGFKDFQEELAPLREIALPMPRLKAATVALVYSYPTLRLSTLTVPHVDNGKSLTTWHSALLYGQWPFEMLFEEDIASDSDLMRYQAIVIPCMKNSYAATLPALEKYLQAGGIVVCGRASFLQDARGATLDSRHLLGLERQPLKVGVDTRADSFQALRIEDVKLITAQPLVKSETGATLVCANQIGAGRLFYFACELPVKALRENLDKLLSKSGVAKHLSLKPEDGRPLDNVEAQIIDRGTEKLLLLLNWADEGSRLVRLELAGGLAGFHVIDHVEKRLIEHDGRGVSLCLRPQARQLLVLAKGTPPQNMEVLSATAIRERFHRERERESVEEDAKRKALAELFAKRNFATVDEEKCQFVDLRRFANMGFADEVADDGRGGWFDQGANDLRTMPCGRQRFSNIPFHIIDPDKNGGNAALVLRGNPKPLFPGRIEGIPVESTAKNIYFLHAMGWGDKPGTTCLKYVLRHNDGDVTEIPIEFGKQIGGWWWPRILPEAKVAFVGANPICPNVGLYCFRWNNPDPGKRIVSLDVISAVSGAVPVVVAITVEKP